MKNPKDFKPMPNAPATDVAVNWLAESLRDELLEYGQLLELLREQQQLIHAEDLGGLARNIGEVEGQSRKVAAYAQQRDYWLAATRRWIGADENVPWEDLIDRLPPEDQLLLAALAAEVNHALETIQALLRQNQQLNVRAMGLR